MMASKEGQTTRRLRSELLVYGYCKTNFDQQIPDVVMDLCTEYSYESELFAVPGKNVTISDDRTITKTHVEDENNIAGEYWNTSYGIIRVNSNDSCIYRWTLKIGKLSTKYMTIGISSNDEYDKNYSAWRSDGREQYLKYYHYAVNGYKGHKTSRQGTENYFGKPFQGGDVLGIVLDLTEGGGYVQFFINGTSPGAAFRNIKQDVDVTYRLAVVLCKQNDSVTLIDFKSEYQ